MDLFLELFCGIFNLLELLIYVVHGIGWLGVRVGRGVRALWRVIRRRRDFPRAWVHAGGRTSGRSSVDNTIAKAQTDNIEGTTRAAGV
jgi:hypothetical protein